MRILCSLPVSSGYKRSVSEKHSFVFFFALKINIPAKGFWNHWVVLQLLPESAKEWRQSSLIILSYKLLLRQPVLSQSMIQNVYTCIIYIHLIKKFLHCLYTHSTTWQKCSFVIWKENCIWSLIRLRAIPTIDIDWEMYRSRAALLNRTWGHWWTKEKHWNRAAMHTCSPERQS